MSCPEGHCITCSDAAEPMRVIAIDEARGLALCADDHGAHHTVEIVLVNAGVGDEVLVHAAVAISRLQEAR